MIFENGEKFACDSCVRGHRVSNCTHRDRQLQHINKKGRPVSQCQHCRSMRRSKSAHVKCDCGQKTNKCVHLQRPLDGHRETCCCNHGGICSCSHKKEPQSSLDTVPESDSEEESSSVEKTSASRKRRSLPIHTNSEERISQLQFDEFGHHKPTYKHAKPHETTGPYSLTRGHSTQSVGSAGIRSRENLHDDFSDAEGGCMLQAQDQRLSKSETTTPLPPLDVTSAQNWQSSYGTTGGIGMFDGQEDMGGPLFSAALSAVSVDWRQYGLDYGSKDMGTFAPSSYSQAASLGGLDHHSAMPSGNASEIEDFPSVDPLGSYPGSLSTSNVFSFTRSQESLANAVGLSSSDLGLTQTGKEAEENRLLESAAPMAPEDTVLNSFVPDMSEFQDDAYFWFQQQGYSGLPTDEPSNTADPTFWNMG
ncbi:hypothetical protein BD289DRAFT_450923 [Coniella lustricola]|uniref:Copper-fist domain-containing protein n=1 Tax=Coniella lustricola TaxID=2025994 RepID=A0A2T3AGQ9_9PEZI|nr:hypothetical protein BD289DRAFT_450923 [Coniella lustricola]